MLHTLLLIINFFCAAGDRRTGTASARQGRRGGRRLRCGRFRHRIRCARRHHGAVAHHRDPGGRVHVDQPVAGLRGLARAPQPRRPAACWIGWRSRVRLRMAPRRVHCRARPHPCPLPRRAIARQALRVHLALRLAPQALQRRQCPRPRHPRRSTELEAARPDGAGTKPRARRECAPAQPLMSRASDDDNLIYGRRGGTGRHTSLRG